MKTYYREVKLRLDNDLFEYDLLLNRFKAETADSPYNVSLEELDAYVIDTFIKPENVTQSWSELSRQKRVLEKTIDRLSNAINHLRIKNSIMNKIIDTFYMTNATEANLKIQQQIKRFTIIAVIFGLVSIFSTIFSTELHNIFISLNVSSKNP